MQPRLFLLILLFTLSLAVLPRAVADEPLAVLAAAGDGVLVGNLESGRVDIRRSGDTITLGDSVVAGEDRALQLLFPDRSTITMMQGTILTFVDRRPSSDVAGDQIAMELVSGRLDLRVSPSSVFVIFSGDDLAVASNAVMTVVSAPVSRDDSGSAALQDDGDGRVSLATLGGRNENSLSLRNLAQAQENLSKVSASDDTVVMLSAMFGLFDNSHLETGEQVHVDASDKPEARWFALLVHSFVNKEQGFDPDPVTGSGDADPSNTALPAGSHADALDWVGSVADDSDDGSCCIESADGDVPTYQYYRVDANGVAVAQGNEVTTYTDFGSFFGSGDCCTQAADNTFSDASRYDGGGQGLTQQWIMVNFVGSDGEVAQAFGDGAAVTAELPDYGPVTTPLPGSNSAGTASMAVFETGPSGPLIPEGFTVDDNDRVFDADGTQVGIIAPYQNDEDYRDAVRDNPDLPVHWLEGFVPEGYTVRDGLIHDASGTAIAVHGPAQTGPDAINQSAPASPSDLVPPLPLAEPGNLPAGTQIAGGFAILDGRPIALVVSDGPESVETFPDDQVDGFGPSDSAFANTQFVETGLNQGYFPTVDHGVTGSSLITGLLGSDPATEVSQQTANQDAQDDAQDAANNAGTNNAMTTTMATLQAVPAGSVNDSANNIVSGGLQFNYSLGVNYATRTVNGSITGIITVGEVGAPFRRIDGNANYAAANGGDPASFTFNTVLNCAGCTADVNFTDADTAVVDVNALGNIGTFTSNLN